MVEMGRTLLYPLPSRRVRFIVFNNNKNLWSLKNTIVYYLYFYKFTLKISSPFQAFLFIDLNPFAAQNNIP